VSAERRVGYPEELLATGFSVRDLDLKSSGQAKDKLQVGVKVFPKPGDRTNGGRG
jgi:hypothetical protein